MKTLDVTGLVGIPFAEADCWEIVRRGLARMGVEVPADPAAVLAAEQDFGRMVREPLCRTGDVLVLESGLAHAPLHVGVCVDAFRFLHTSAVLGESHVAEIAAYVRARKIRRRVRPLALWLAHREGRA